MTRRTGTWRNGAAALTLIVGLPLIAGGAAAAGPDRRAFIEHHRCDVVERLRSIHLRGPRSTSKDRFLTAGPYGNADHYVQCIFFDDDARMGCEAASGAYSDRPDLLDGRAIAALKALGFALEDPRGNFARTIDIGAPPDLDRVADLMLGALHDGYGVSVADTLQYNAPMARLPRGACPGPVSRTGPGNGVVYSAAST